MRYLLISGIYPPDSGGPATFVPNLAKHLLAKGNKVTVLSLKSKKTMSTEERWKLILISRNLPKIFRIPITILTLYKQARKSDLLFANGLHEESVIAAILAKKRIVLKIVGDPIWERAINLNKTADSIQVFNEKRLSGSLSVQRKFLSWAITKADLIICPSKQLERFIMKWCPASKIKVIPNGIEMQPLKTRERYQYDIIYIGRITEWKDVGTLITAVHSLSCKLAIVGDGPDKEALQNICMTLNLKVDFLGEKSRSEIQQLFSTTKIFCLPSKYEGMSHALLEAMSAGIPVIASDIEANKEVIKDNIDGLLFKVGDAKDLSQKIEKLLDSKEFANSLSKNALIKVMKNYEISNILDTYLKVLAT